LHIWNRLLHTSFLSWGFTRLECEWCVYVRHLENGTSSVVAIHVDNMLAVSSSMDKVAKFRTELESDWKISALGEPKLVVGIALRRDRNTRSIELHQTALINKIITTFGQSDARPASTPWHTEHSFCHLPQQKYLTTTSTSNKLAFPTVHWWDC
jgi:hypothetical protein